MEIEMINKDYRSTRQQLENMTLLLQVDADEILYLTFLATPVLGQ